MVRICFSPVLWCIFFCWLWVIWNFDLKRNLTDSKKVNYIDENILSFHVHIIAHWAHQATWKFNSLTFNFNGIFQKKKEKDWCAPITFGLSMSLQLYVFSFGSQSPLILVIISIFSGKCLHVHTHWINNKKTNNKSWQQTKQSKNEFMVAFLRFTNQNQNQKEISTCIEQTAIYICIHWLTYLLYNLNC